MEAARHLRLEKQTVKVLSAMGAISMQILSQKQDFISGFLTTVITMVTGGKESGTTTSTSLSNGLGALAHLIIKCEERNAGLDFELGINLIRFIIKLEYLQKISNTESSINIIRQEVKKSSDKSKGEFTEDKGKRWREGGYKLAELMGAGRC